MLLVCFRYQVVYLVQFCLYDCLFCLILLFLFVFACLFCSVLICLFVFCFLRLIYFICLFVINALLDFCLFVCLFVCLFLFVWSNVFLFFFIYLFGWLLLIMFCLTIIAGMVRQYKSMHSMSHDLSTVKTVARETVRHMT